MKMGLKMRCFSTSCFGIWKHKKTFKKVHDQPLSPSNELREAVTLLGATTTESLQEEEIIVKTTPQPVSEFDPNCDKLVENEKGNLSSRIQEIPIAEKEGVPSNSEKTSLDDNSKGDCFTGLESESSDSLFSLSIDSRKRVFTADMGDKEVTSPLRPNNNNNKSVCVMDKSSSCKFDDENSKENVGSEPLLKQSPTVEAAASLSSWLNVSRKTNIGKCNSNSPGSEKNYRANNAELKQMSESSPGASQLGIGTVGPARACLAEILLDV